MEVNPNANYDFQIAQIYGEKGNFEQMFQSFINMIDKNENYLNTIQRYISRYITDDNQNSNNILFKKHCYENLSVNLKTNGIIY